MARAEIGGPFSAFSMSMAWLERSQTHTRPSSRPAASRLPTGVAATRLTIELSSKPTSAACLPSGPAEPVKGQMTAPLAPEVASIWPL